MLYSQFKTTFKLPTATTFFMDEDAIKKKLTEKEYYVLREHGTEMPFTGEHYKRKDNGNYLCKVCGAKLFDSKTKFDSGSGWPSFDTATNGSVELITDKKFGMTRTEVRCKKCGSHLGHVFDDGPTDTGKRFCINSVCLDFKQKGSQSKTEKN